MPPATKALEWERTRRQLAQLYQRAREGTCLSNYPSVVDMAPRPPREGGRGRAESREDGSLKLSLASDQTEKLDEEEVQAAPERKEPYGTRVAAASKCWMPYTVSPTR